MKKNSLNDVLNYYRIALPFFFLEIVLLTSVFRTDSFKEPPTIDTLRDSIFIPRFATPALPAIPADHTEAYAEWLCTDHARYYGTREQTVILVDRDNGRVVYTERTLWDEHAQRLSKEDGDTREEFYIERWNDSA